MAYVTTTRSNASLTDFFARLVQGVQLATQRRRVYQQTLTELNALSDRDLSDLGLHRAAIQSVAKAAAYGK
jgi:uncharacterized protein YjiS (DUF1127 family)